MNDTALNKEITCLSEKSLSVTQNFGILEGSGSEWRNFLTKLRSRYVTFW